MATKSRTFRIEFEREDNGLWIAEIASIPGVMAYGATRLEAHRRVVALALRVLADEVEGGSNLSGIRFTEAA